MIRISQYLGMVICVMCSKIDQFFPCTGQASTDVVDIDKLLKLSYMTDQSQTDYWEASLSMSLAVGL